MLERWRLRRLKGRLRESLEADRLQPDGGAGWVEAATTSAALEACPEPGWRIHLAFWSGASAAVMLRAVLDGFERAAASEPSLLGLLRAAERARLRAAANQGAAGRFADKAELITVLVRHEGALATARAGAADGGGARVALAEALLVGAARARATEPPGEDGPVDARAALALLALAALHVEDGRREWAAQCLAESGALLARALPARREDVLDAMRSALREPPPLASARAVRGAGDEGPDPSDGERGPA